MTEQRGLFISFEGNDGSGKSTQAKLLGARLRQAGYSVIDHVEPGGTAIGQQIRRILLDPQNDSMSPVSELLLMFASRAQAAEERIRPALARGDIVISDRFTDSSLAYQGLGRGLGFELVRNLHRLALGSLFPDLTIYTELDLETSLSRAHGRNRLLAAAIDQQNRLDRQSLEFHRRVRDGYKRIAREEPDRFIVVPADDTPEHVSDSIWAIVEPRLASRPRL